MFVGLFAFILGQGPAFAKAVVDSQDFENRMLKAYIRDWPVGEGDEQAPG